MPKRIINGGPTVSQGEELRAIREHVGCSQRLFATRLGVTPRSLSRWECGLRPIPTCILRLARFYAVWAVPSSHFVPDPAPSDPNRPTIELHPGSQCHWRAADCRGPWYVMEARISRRRSVHTEACAVHLQRAYEAIGFLIEHKRLPWRRRERLKGAGRMSPAQKARGG